VASSEMEENALLLIEIIDKMVAWADPAFDAIRRDKWKIMARRIMAGSGADLDEFIHNVVRDIAGDKVIMSDDLGKKIQALHEKLGQKQQDLIRFVKRRAYPLVVRYMAIRSERGEK